MTSMEMKYTENVDTQIWKENTMPIDLLALSLLPSSANLISSVLSGAAHATGGWLAKKALDVTFKCDKCGKPRQERIENVAHNDLYCHNCHCAVHQFTNACAATVSKKGDIAHIGMQLGIPLFLGGHIYWGWSDVQVYSTIRLLGLHGTQVVGKHVLKNFETDEVLKTSKQVLQSNSDDS